MKLDIKGDPKKKSKPVTALFTILIVAYLVFILGQSLYKNYQTNQDIKDLEKEVQLLKEKNSRLKNLVLYYQTDSYKEKAARQKLLVKKPGEKVIAVPEAVEESTTDDKKEKVKNLETDPSKEKPNKPNYQLWLDYIFS